MQSRTRVPDLAQRLLRATDSDQVICTEDCHIEVPSRFMEAGLGNLGTVNHIYGSLAIINAKGEYTVTNIPNLLEFEPYDIREMDIDDMGYYRFDFKKGQPIFLNVNVVMSDDLMYNIMNEYLFKGKVPWYIEPDDAYKLFDFAKSHANSNIAISYQVMEFITSLVVRQKNKRQVPYRVVHKSAKTEKDFEFVALSSVYYGVQAPMNKLSGAYMQDGIISALVTKPQPPGKIETLLRS